MLVASQVIDPSDNFIKNETLRANVSKYLDERNGLFLFDVDGTLAETESLHWEAYNIILSRQGIYLKHEDILRYIGNPEIKIYQMIREDYGAIIDDISFMKERISIFLELVKSRDLQLFEYVKPLLRHYSSVSMALVTSQRPEVVDILMEKWGLADRFPPSARISCSEGNISKSTVYSNPWDFLPEFEPTDLGIVVFEDASHALKAAQDAGLGTIGIENIFNRGSWLGETVIQTYTSLNIPHSRDIQKDTI